MVGGACTLVREVYPTLPDEGRIQNTAFRELTSFFHIMLALRGLYSPEVESFANLSCFT